MNCKPGDLAVVVSQSKHKCPPQMGAIVVIGEGMWGNCWRTLPATIDPRDGREVAIPDSHLRPIRDPGDDARDETLDWLPVPTREGVPA